MNCASSSGIFLSTGRSCPERTTYSHESVAAGTLVRPDLLSELGVARGPASSSPDDLFHHPPRHRPEPAARRRLQPRTRGSSISRDLRRPAPPLAAVPATRFSSRSGQRVNRSRAISATLATVRQPRVRTVTEDPIARAGLRAEDFSAWSASHRGSRRHRVWSVTACSCVKIKRACDTMRRRLPVPVGPPTSSSCAARDAGSSLRRHPRRWPCTPVPPLTASFEACRGRTPPRGAWGHGYSGSILPHSCAADFRSCSLR